jgi:hypothetical protein
VIEHRLHAPEELIAVHRPDPIAKLSDARVELGRRSGFESQRVALLQVEDRLLQRRAPPEDRGRVER